MRAKWISAEQGLRALFLFVAVFLFACSSPPPPQYQLSGATMGTVWQVRLSELPEGMDLGAVNAELEQLLELVNQQMSTYRHDSVISQYNQAEAGTWHTVPPEFALVLTTALELADISHGAFDPTVGPLVNLWGFGPQARSETTPTAETIQQVKAEVGWEKIQTRQQGREVLQPGGIYLDFSAIAKGYAVDLLGERLTELGVSGWLVDIGGDLRTYGYKSDGEPWFIAVERPNTQVREAGSILALHGKAVATSGDYRNYYDTQEGHFSHTIDPRTGWPVEHQLASVTVLEESCMLADGLATLLTVLGPKEGLAFAEAQGLEVYFIEREAQDEGVRFAETMTAAFKQYLKEE